MNERHKTGVKYFPVLILALRSARPNICGVWRPRSLRHPAVNCHFYPYDYGHMATALSGVTGAEYNIHDILEVGARAQTLSRLFNLREGFTADDDKLPKRVMRAFKHGPLVDVELSDDAFNWAKRRHYELMQWDMDSGAPREECLEELKLHALLEIGHSSESFLF